MVDVSNDETNHGPNVPEKDAAYKIILHVIFCLLYSEGQTGYSIQLVQYASSNKAAEQ